MNIYFGHSSESLLTCLSVDEVLKEEAKKNKNVYFRTSLIDPGVVVARDEDINDINLENCLKDGIFFTRRFSLGSVIYTDHNLLYYIVVFPSNFISPVDTFNYFGYRIAKTLKSLLGVDIWLGEKFSIAVEPSPYKVIAGNSWENLHSKGYGFFQGVLAIKKHPIDSIRKYVKLRKNDTVDEERIIESLPSLSDFKPDLNVEYLSKKLADSVLDEYEEISVEDKNRILNKAKSIEKKFKDEDWISNRNKSKIVSNLGYCLIALSEEWQEKNFRRI